MGTTGGSGILATAQACEAAHHNPDGALPGVNAQACDAGYAEMIFTQTTAPPGYTATYVFRAPPSGWQEIASSDFVLPGQFGMPVNAGKAMNASLAAAPENEQVPF